MALSRHLSIGLVGLISGAGSGVPRYATALTRALDATSAEFPDLRLTFLTTRDGAEAVGARRIAVRDIGLVLTGAPRVALEQAVAASARADFLHFFDLTGPVLAPWRRFTATVHDVALVAAPRRRRHSYRRLLGPWAAHRAHRLVAVSEFAKAEAAAHYRLDESRIRVIHSGPGLTPVTPKLRGDDGAQQSPYFLYVGDLTARKNVPFLVRAFDRADVDADLVLVGAADDGYGEVRNERERARRADRIRILGAASDQDVDRLYRSALALVMPSRYEGFGFTPLEAMARGCPVLAGDIPAIREISGPGALLEPVDDEVRWAESIRRLASDAALRDGLRARGARTVARYSWQETARGLCRLFLELGDRAGR